MYPKLHCDKHFQACVYCMRLRFQSNYFGLSQPMYLPYLENATACSKRKLKSSVATQLKRKERESISGIKLSFKRIEERHQGNCNLQLNLRKWYTSQCDTFLCKWIGYKRVMVNSFYSIDFRLTIEVCTHRTQLHYSD